MFLDEMQKRYPSESEFSSFFGTFTGIGAVLIFLGQTLVFNRYVARFGLLAAMIALPIVLGTFGLRVVAAGGMNSGILFFWMIVVQRMGYMVVGSVMDDPAQGVLLQAVPPSQQGSLTRLIGGIVAPITTAIAGAMLLLQTTLDSGAVTLNLVLLPVIVVWIVLSVLARNGYVTAILETVTRRSLPKATLDMAPDVMAELVAPKLQSGSPGEVIYCLRLLEEARHSSLARRLLEQLDQDEPVVIRYVLERIESLHLTEAADRIRQVIDFGADGIRSRAVIAYYALKEDESVEEIGRYLESDDRDLQQGAIVSVLPIELLSWQWQARRHYQCNPRKHR